MTKKSKGLECLKAKDNGSDKTYLSSRPASLIAYTEIELYQLADAASIMLRTERNQLKKTLKAAAVDVPISTSSIST